MQVATRTGPSGFKRKWASCAPQDRGRALSMSPSHGAEDEEEDGAAAHGQGDRKGGSSFPLSA